MHWLRLKIFFHCYLLICTTNVFAENPIWITGWRETSSMLISRAGAATVTDGKHIYIIGGVDGKNFLATVENAAINPDGKLQPWRYQTSLPEPRAFMSAVVFDRRIYVVGGANGQYGENLLNTMLSAQILENGDISAWHEEPRILNIPRRCAKLVLIEDQLLALGGYGGGLLDSVEQIQLPISPASQWHLLDKPLTTPRYVNEVKIVNDQIVVIGGHHPSSGVGLASVESASWNPGSSYDWKATNSLKQGRYGFGSGVIKNTLYVLGGISGLEYLDTVEKTVVNSRNNALIWQNTTQLPLFMANLSAVSVQNRMYILGGSTRHEYLNKVWYSETNESGELGYWGDAQEYESYQKNTLKKAENNFVLPNLGLVVDQIDTESYSYLRVERDGHMIWLAVPAMQSSVIKRKIRYSEGVFMSNFYSKSLKRQFESILFVGSVNIE